MSAQSFFWRRTRDEDTGEMLMDEKVNWVDEADMHGPLDHPRRLMVGFPGETRKEKLDEKGQEVDKKRRERLYEHGSDPLEQQDRVQELAEKAAELRRVLVEFRDRPGTIQGDPWPTPGESDAALLERLAMIGYTGPLPGREDVFFGAENCSELRGESRSEQGEE